MEETKINLEEIQTRVEEKAKELSAKYNVKVTPFFFVTKDKKEVIEGYLREPGRLDKMRAIDLYEQSRTQAGALLLITSLLKGEGESDPRIMDEKPSNDSIYLGAIEVAIDQVEMLNNLIKKK